MNKLTQEIFSSNFALKNSVYFVDKNKNFLKRVSLKIYGFFSNDYTAFLKIEFCNTMEDCKVFDTIEFRYVNNKKISFPSFNSNTYFIDYNINLFNRENVKVEDFIKFLNYVEKFRENLIFA